jgi:hypothetical protein
MPSAIAYTSVEYDRREHWVTEAKVGFRGPPTRIVGYAPTKGEKVLSCSLKAVGILP